MTWLALAILNTVSVAIARVLQKYILQNPKIDSISLAIAFQILTSLIIFFASIFIDTSFIGYESYWANFILMAFLYTFANYFLFNAYKVSEASIVSLILSSTSVWTIIYSLMFLNEDLTGGDLIGILLIVFSLVLINYEGLKNFRNIGKGEIYAVISGMFFGFALGNDFYIIGDRSPYVYTAISFMLPGIFTALIFRNKIILVKEFAKFKNFALLFILSLFYAVSVLSIMLAYQSGGKSSELSPISQTSVFLVVLISAIFLKERQKLFLKFFASIIAFTGVLALATI